MKSTGSTIHTTISTTMITWITLYPDTDTSIFQYVGMVTSTVLVEC